MGYTTTFEGHFKFNRQLTLDEKVELDEIAEKRHEESGAPGLYCQWVADKYGYYLHWDGGEKFYDYVEWLTWLINNFFQPKKIFLNGSVMWNGEEADDLGKIIVKNNVVLVKEDVITYDEDKVRELSDLLKEPLAWYKEYRDKELTGEVDSSYTYDMAEEEFHKLSRGVFQHILEILSTKSVKRK